MNCLISDAPSWRAIDSLFDGVCADAEILILTSSLTASDLASSVLRHPAVRDSKVTVISDRSRGNADPAVDLLDPRVYHQSWIDCQTRDGRPVAFEGNVIVIHSDGEVRAAIGSAPLLNDRWSSDRDVWGTIHSRCGITPVALHDLAELLHELYDTNSDQFLLDPAGRFALYTAASEIAGHRGVNTHARVLSNLEMPIAELLRGNVPLPATDLVMYTPAYHPQLYGVDALISTLRPTGSTTIYTYQRPDTKTVVERAGADGISRSVYIDRAIHKRAETPDATIIQWRDGENTWTLTGLTGISDDTLARNASADGAGLQIALLSQTDMPLLPWSEHIQPHWQTRVLQTPDISHI